MKWPPFVLVFGLSQLYFADSALDLDETYVNLCGYQYVRVALRICGGIGRAAQAYDHSQTSDENEDFKDSDVRKIQKGLVNVHNIRQFEWDNEEEPEDENEIQVQIPNDLLDEDNDPVPPILSSNKIAPRKKCCLSICTGREIYDSCDPARQ